MDKLRKLIVALRTRGAGLKNVAKNCDPEGDRIVLQARADEAERCASLIEDIIETEKRSAQ